MSDSSRPIPVPPVVKESPLAMIETAWGIICNASGGDWSKESAAWQEAAARFRTEFYALLDAHGGHAAFRRASEPPAAVSGPLAQPGSGSTGAPLDQPTLDTEPVAWMLNYPHAGLIPTMQAPSAYDREHYDPRPLAYAGPRHTENALCQEGKCKFCDAERLKLSAPLDQQAAGSTGGAPTRDEISRPELMSVIAVALLETQPTHWLQKHVPEGERSPICELLADAILARWPAASRVPSESILTDSSEAYRTLAAVREALGKLADYGNERENTIDQWLGGYDILEWCDHEYPLSSESPDAEDGR